MENIMQLLRAVIKTRLPVPAPPAGCLEGNIFLPGRERRQTMYIQDIFRPKRSAQGYKKDHRLSDSPFMETAGLEPVTYYTSSSCSPS